MDKIPDAIYNRINNKVYETPGDIWWDTNSVLHILKTSVNPWRVGYAARVLKQLSFNTTGKTALEVGCGGGILTEEIHQLGFNTTGIDPAEASVLAAANHAKSRGWPIRYAAGSGEHIPFADASFDAVFCCDVLEHVKDLPRVIAEISRVLKPGGVFIYDTINRTFVSKLVAIKIWQEWKRWAFMPPHLHVWDMFIKPSEIRQLLRASGLEWQEHIGSKPNISLPKMLGYLRNRAKGKWGFVELGQHFQLVEDKDMNMLYAGYAIKP
ncbi:bifunctional 2-polyprenyl-6-hydroxyphenol methylase/3-demethylubiquinol 3-O-methyltransferase UbiG [Niabella yanshanensis]|uniref:Bifunctional 2-polyprenyl-6-hydroxyphenol methylase/3-demethylubiquinol 3-O-methyltransferase UbiG n=1 Tax=Niabella yanshanensis TaxID=577386 RepID=A0ABZ0W8D0_9BACT|nr:bifunctional 2-polyprenyl-6-hydroxyphenol methylase/3-demethylubiquinol 3-O-methyltransferase UbiG [Niabella yanshanensis]WQD38245.1 bifunctional 2-polyprenyl-6-hydroxyphenol methylase/3-demethylubiquinol 3-O-methyltransferase UbiG [Niabella yanshanensis]